MRRTAILALLTGLAVTGCTMLDTGPDRETQTVTTVIDGDTIVLADGDRVRLLGINTPEQDMPHNDAATERLRELVEDRDVTLEQDDENQDRYGRLLRYVYVNNTFVNRQLVAEGLATTYFVDDTYRYRDQLEAAQREAQQHERGLWQQSSVADCIRVTDFNWNPPGDDNYQLNEEQVTFQNTCQQPVNMTNWTVKDAGTNMYRFDTMTLQPGTTLTLHSGSGTSTGTDRYWHHPHAVWNNDGDALYLRDRRGALAAWYQYTAEQ